MNKAHDMLFVLSSTIKELNILLIFPSADPIKWRRAL